MTSHDDRLVRKGAGAEAASPDEPGWPSPYFVCQGDRVRYWRIRGPGNRRSIPPVHGISRGPDHGRRTIMSRSITHRLARAGRAARILMPALLLAGLLGLPVNFPAVAADLHQSGTIQIKQ